MFLIIAVQIINKLLNLKYSATKRANIFPRWRMIKNLLILDFSYKFEATK